MAERFVQERARHGPETMSCHFIGSEAEAAEAGIDRIVREWSCGRSDRGKYKR